MKKYVFEAARRQLEKPTEPKYVFCTAARTVVLAETEEEAQLLAQRDLDKMYHGSGVALGALHCVSAEELPVDWDYGYGERTDKNGLIARYVIR